MVVKVSSLIWPIYELRNSVSEWGVQIWVNNSSLTNSFSLRPSAKLFDPYHVADIILLNFYT